jgi:CelD/BcsL family acetyltransferase involved in cellulose biosynthesis
MDAAARSLNLLDLKAIAKGSVHTAAKVSPVHSVDLQLVAERPAFDALESEWNDLFARAGKSTHVFQSFNFCWHWANHYLTSSPDDPTGIKLSIVTGRHNGRLIMLWPLVSQRVRGVRQTFWMGEPVGQYGDVLIDAEADALSVLRPGLEFLRARTSSDLLRLRRVRTDANVAPFLSEIGAQIADRQIAPHMDLTSAKDFAGFEQRYSGKTRKNRRRLARRLEEKGAVEFVRLHGGDQARDLAIQAIELKASWLKDRGLISSAIANERISSLFADLAEGRKKPVDCIVSALKSNGEAAAIEVSFTCKGRLAMHLIAFNLEYEKSGAGVLLLEQSLKDGYAEGLEVYDMLAPGDPYKLDWCDQSDAVLDWVKPLSLAGYLYARVYLGFLRGRVKSALKAMPKPLRRLMRDGYVRAAPADRRRLVI